MKRILTILAAAATMVVLSANASAQSGYEVKGRVVDSQGPVIGATVLEQGTTNGISTDLDGNYSLRVSSSEAIVEISCIGYATLEYKASAVPSQVVLSEDSEFLDEAVAIGYGSLSKKELSSSIVQVDKEKFYKGSMNNIMELMTGQVAGLTVNTTAAANPNSTSSLQIRGATSISASNDPLIVIDGVPGGDIRNIAAQDVESMTVLKDAASAAIYGTRGANGVILITTKRGSDIPDEQAHITYDSWFSVNLARNVPEVLSADEYRRSLRGNDYGYDTDWYDLISNDFSYQNNQYLAIDGNSRSGSYSASLNYKNATGLDIVSEREEYGGRIALDQKLIKNRLSVNFVLNVRRVNETWGNDGLFNTALTMNPTMPVKNEDGSYYQPTNSTGALNPVAELNLVTNNGQRNYILGTAEVKYNILMMQHHNLSTSVTYSLQYNDLKSNYYAPSESGVCFWGGYDGTATLSYNKYWTDTVEWLVNYQFNKGNHDVKFVGGYSYEEYNTEYMGMTNRNFAYDNLLYNDIGSGTYLSDGTASMSSSKSRSKLIGVFGRVNYNWKNIIMASASIRYEGSTKFGANNKWGAFPAASIAWEMANMDFMESARSVVSSLKPRVSYGVTGRSDFSSYQSISTYSSSGTYLMDGTWVTGYAPTNNSNPDLAWEKLVSVNAGVDFALFNNRLRGSVDWFLRQSQDLLYSYTAPQPPFVYSSILVNVGTTQNTGVELSIEGDVIKSKDWSWTTGVNYSTGKTKLKKLSNDVYQASYVDMYGKSGVGTSEYFFRIAEGSEVGQFYGYKYAGVTEDGDMLVYNADNEVISVSSASASDKRYIGNGEPRHIIAWNNTIRWKNFDLGLTFTGAFGYKIFNMWTYSMGLTGSGTDNVLKTAYTDYDYISASGGVISSFFLENGDYFKLENATLGYSFKPKNPDSILNNLRVYVSAKNVFTITGYSGTNPSMVPSTGLTPSVDEASAYPESTQVTLGLTLRF